MKHFTRRVPFRALLVFGLRVLSTTPVLLQVQSDSSVTLSQGTESALVVWHDDCSSTEGWIVNTTFVENLVSQVQPEVSLLTDGDGLYSDTIPGLSVSTHGVQFFERLDTPMTVSDDLNIKAEIQHIGTSGMYGTLGVILFDQFNNTVFKMGSTDSWASSECTAWVAYKEGENQTTQYNTLSDGWNGTVRMWYDRYNDSVKGYANGRIFTLASSGKFDSSREVHMVCIVFYAPQNYPYESDYVRDILVTSRTEVSKDTFRDAWHHDCSNTSAFARNESWPMPWLQGSNEWSITAGDLRSNGSVLSFGGIPSASGWHGPVFVHELEYPIALENLRNFTVKLAVDNTQAGDVGKVFVCLADSEGFAILKAYVGDAWSGSSKGHIFAEYEDVDLNAAQHGLIDVDDFTSFDGRMMFAYNLTTGLSCEVTGYGLTRLSKPTISELDREITHIVVMSARSSTITYMPCTIDDIYLEWQYGQSTDNPEDLGIGYLVLVSTGLASIGVIIVIIVVLVRKR